ncbi:MAG: hypothetical protein C0485_18255 [Pirellula sp.]|nr:hypothetical protein [Pirellula sp.]
MANSSGCFTASRQGKLRIAHGFRLKHHRLRSWQGTKASPLLHESFITAVCEAQVAAASATEYAKGTSVR